MNDKDMSASIASLADKVADYHSRLLTVERELEKHKKECNCNKSQQPPVPEFKEQEEEECVACSA